MKPLPSLLCVLLATSAYGQETGVELIDPDKAGSAAVVVADSLPLVHTRQILVKDAKDLQPARKQLEAILHQAGSSLDRLVKVNFVLTSDDQRDALRKELAQGTFGAGQPAVSFVSGKLPGDAVLALDVVAVGRRKAAWKTIGLGEDFAILPPGTRVFVSGQAVPGKDLAEATRKTLDELQGTLKFLGLTKASIVQVKAFVQPMAQHQVVEKEIATFFQVASEPVPPVVLVEWHSTLPIEIELIAWGGRERPGEPIEFLTPPGMKASPVYSRVARINDGKVIYLSSLHGKTANDPTTEVPEIFDQLGKILVKAGSDYRHLAKATYYVTSPEATKAMGAIRPRYYDPLRPPSASLAMVQSTGLPRRTVTLDMIAVPSLRLKVNEYGPPERGHGLSDAEVRAGYVALFDGKSDFGWTGATVQDGILLAGKTNFTASGGTIRVNAARPGTLRWGRDILLAKTGVTEVALTGATERQQLTLADGLQLRSLSYKPAALVDLTPRSLGDWVPLHHPKLPKERQATWTVKDGVVSVTGGPGCLEFQKIVFGNFVLQMEVRTKARHANSGVFFRSIPGSFMNGYEAQIYNRCHDADPSRPWTWATGAIDDRQNARRLASRDGDWFHYTIAAQGARLATWINGQQTVDWLDTRDEDDNPRKGRRVQAGTVQLQAHDAATDVEFRKIRIGEEK